MQLFFPFFLTMEKVGAIYHNLGNLETATGNLEDSTDYYDQATDIWIKGGDTTASQLALTYLCVGRVFVLQNKLTEARDMVARSEALFVRVLGADRGFTAQYVDLSPSSSSHRHEF